MDTFAFEVGHQENGQETCHKKASFILLKKLSAYFVQFCLPSPTRRPSTHKLLDKYLCKGCVAQMWGAPMEGLNCRPTPTLILYLVLHWTLCHPLRPEPTPQCVNKHLSQCLSHEGAQCIFIYIRDMICYYALMINR